MTTADSAPRESRKRWTVPTRAQRRLWIAEEMATGSEYNVPLGLRIHGDLDAAALERAVDTIVARHESLRARLVLDDGGDLVVDVAEPEASLLRRVDLSGEDEPEDRLAGLGARLSNRRFDLADEVLRAALVRLGPAQHVLLVVGHHVVFDEWSVASFFRELEIGYAVARGGADPARMLPPVRFGYADLVDEEQAGAVSGDLDRQTAWWAEHLAGALPCDLPGDRPRAAAPSGSAGQVFFSVPAPLAAGLDAVARRHGATPFMTLLAVFHALVRRRTGREDVTVGTLVSGRSATERHGLLISLVNLLAVRTRLPGSPAFADLLGAVRTAVLGAFAHQEATVADALARLRATEPEASGELGVLFEFQNTTAQIAGLLGVTDDLPTLPGLRTTAHLLPGVTTRFDLEMKIAATGPDRLEGVLVYTRDRFDEPTVRGIVEEFRTLLDAVVADPSAPC